MDQNGKVGVSLKKNQKSSMGLCSKMIYRSYSVSQKICGNFIKIIWIRFSATQATQSLKMALKEFVFGVNSIMK